jgi:hypothetical protein
MSTMYDTILNIQGFGFPEVPEDAFDVFDLPMHPPILIRTYRAYCPLCYIKTDSTNLSIREIHCMNCIEFVIKIQSWYKVRKCVKKYKNTLISKELMYRVFFKKEINGFGLSDRICKFL